MADVKAWLPTAWFFGPLVVCLRVSPAYAEPQRQGFTGDLGLGLAFTSVPQDSISLSCDVTGGCISSEEESCALEIGLAPLSLSLGGFLSPSAALLFRIGSTSYFKNGDQIVHGFYGPILELWLHERFYASGGVGLGLFGPNTLLSSGSQDVEAGVALDLRAGAALINGTDHDLTLSLEVIPGFYDGEVVIGSALVVAWKWY